MRCGRLAASVPSSLSCLAVERSCPTAVASSASLATMTMFTLPPEVISAIFAGMRTLPAMNAGISSVKTMKERLRTRSRYSRLRRIQTLCMLAHLIDEDLLQRRFQQLEAADAGALRGEAQQLLR